MSTHHTPGTEVATSASAPVPERFDNPGLPEHRHRLTDVDPAAAKTAERVVAGLFGLSMLGTIGFLVAYFAVQLNGTTGEDRLDRLALSNAALGFSLFAAMFGIGAGAVHWAKTLMPDVERTEERHPQRSSDEDRAAAVAILKEGAAEAGLGRRPLIRNTLIGSLGLAALAPVPLLRDLGPMPGKKLSESFWKEGMRLVNDMTAGKPVKASDLTLGSVVHVMPEGIDESHGPLEERAKAAVLLIRLDPSDLNEESRAGAYEGIVAYSKICTHMGCPVGLYEQQTHHLLCPCHQSTFDVTQNCKVIFGPAKRPLPQLAITVDADGYLVARGDFSQAPGPSFWERG